MIAVAGACTGPAGPAGPGGDPGAPGQAGDDGANGADGANGTDGSNGLSTLVRVDDVAPASCPAGGRTIHVGVDDDGDGVLDDSEIDSTLPSCDVREPLVVAARVPPGPICAVGGIVTRLGYDDDDDGVLDDDELTRESAACDRSGTAILAVMPDFSGDVICDIGRFSTTGRSLAWSQSTPGFRCEATPSPWGSVVVSQGTDVVELDATTGLGLGSFPAAGTLLVDDERQRLYVNEGGSITAFDLVTRAAVGTVDFNVEQHQPMSMVLSDDGTRLIAATFDGSIFHLHDLDPAAMVQTGTQALGSTESISTMFLIGQTLAMWDDNVDQFRVYTGAPLVEDRPRRVTFVPDGGASATITAVRDPNSAVVYVARAFSPQIVRLQLDLLPATSTFVLPDVAGALLMAEDGSHLTAHTNGGFIEVLLPSGIVRPSPLAATVLPRVPFALHHVQVGEH